MYNSDGTVKPRTARGAGGQSTLNLSWGDDHAKENIAHPNDLNQAAAGVKSIVTLMGEPQPTAKQRPGAAVRHRANQGSLRFSDDGDEDVGQLPRGMSEAKRKALYESNVFGNSQIGEQQPAHALSDFKKKEQTGNDIFHHTNKPQEHQRSVLGGVKKAPGGGGSLTMQNLHPGTPQKKADNQQEAL